MTQSRIYLALTVAAILVAACASAAFAAQGAFDLYTGPIDNGTGASLNLTDVAEYGGYTANLQSLIPAGPAIDAVVGQPLLAISNASTNWTGFGMCIDTADLIYTGTVNPGYHVYNWATAKSVGKIGTIQGITDSVDYIWDRLTYMWCTTTVATDTDRAALQFATWLGCADQWNGLSGTDFTYSGLSSAVLTEAKADLNAAVANNATYANNFGIAADGNKVQLFAVAIPAPEPTGLVSMVAMISFAGAALRFRRH